MPRLDSINQILQFNKFISYWISEADRGIYHAMNKGIDLATGDYILFLNSGDFLENDKVLESISPYLTSDLVYGNISFLKNNKKELVRYPKHLPFSFFIEGLNSLPHPATFISKKLFYKVGQYNENYTIVSDWTFFLLAINKYCCTYCHVDILISVYNLEGISSLPENANIVQKERFEILSHNFPTFIDDYRRLKELEEQMKKIRNYWVVKVYNNLKNIFNFN